MPVEPVLRLENISKNFPGVKALDNVSLNVYEAKIMALMGENGAGKSTLMKVITGIYSKDSGSMFLRGQEVTFKNIHDSQNAGIGIIHQELNLIPDLTVYENIFLGRELTTSILNRIDRKLMISETQKILKNLGFGLLVTEKIKNLSLAQQQIVEIAKCISTDVSIIIMDEPTDTLTKKEAKQLFTIIERLKTEGKSIIYISHRLEEIFQIADDITVYRDGCFIAENKTVETDENELIRLMVGRSIEEQFPFEKAEIKSRILELDGVSNQYVNNVSLSLARGEVLGFAGLIGSGRTELAKTILGAFAYGTGKIMVSGTSLEQKSIKKSLKHGIAYVSEDRKKEGLVLVLSIRHNMSLSFLCADNSGLRSKTEKIQVTDFMQTLSIKSSGINQLAKELSGGNQQKVAIAKALMLKPQIIILDEPTRGIDVGAKKEIYLLINELKKQGIAIILISSEMPELMGLSDRILVMSRGQVAGILRRDQFNAETIMEMAVS